MIAPGVQLCNQHSWSKWSKTILPMKVCCFSVLIVVLKGHIWKLIYSFENLPSKTTEKEPDQFSGGFCFPFTI